MAAVRKSKLFVGNLQDNTQASEVRVLFQKYGNVLDCVVVKNYCFIYMETEEQGHRALKNLNGYFLNGRTLKVEEAKCRRASTTLTTKIFVGNLTEKTRESEIRELFSNYGTVVECDIIQNYCFVHLDCVGDVYDCIKILNGHLVNGRPLRVQVSKSHVRPKPGMSDPRQCFRCGRLGHWSNDCSYLCGANAGGPDLGPNGYADLTYGRDVYQPPLVFGGNVGIPDVGPDGYTDHMYGWDPYQPPAQRPLLLRSRNMEGLRDYDYYGQCFEGSIDLCERRYQPSRMCEIPKLALPRRDIVPSPPPRRSTSLPRCYGRIFKRRAPSSSSQT